MIDEQYERAITSWLARTATVTRGLAEQYEDLAGYVAATGGGPGDVTGIRGSSTHPAIPIRVGVVDLRAEIDAAARRHCDLVRDTLRAGAVVIDGANATRRRLWFIAGSLARLWEENEGTAEGVTSELWTLHERASHVVEPPTGRRPFRIEEPCLDCGAAALWVDPKAWLIACGMPSCRGKFGIDRPVLRHRSETP